MTLKQTNKIGQESFQDFHHAILYRNDSNTSYNNASLVYLFKCWITVLSREGLKAELSNPSTLYSCLEVA